MSEEFIKHIRALLKSSDFADVTLVSDDQKIFKGHKNILSGFSPVLRNLFKVDSQYHQTLLHLNGINSTEIGVLMEFIYSNTLPKVWTKQLQSAIISLQIKGLQKHIPENIEVVTEKGTVDDILEESKEAKDLILKPTNTEVGESYVKKNAKENIYKVKLSDLVKISVQDSLNKPHDQNKVLDSPSLNESVPNKPSPNESNTERVEYKCDLCNFIATQNYKLQQHTNKKHLGIKEDTPCDKCDYNPRDRGNLLKHKRVVHEGLRLFPCNLCEYKSSARNSLNEHILSIHEGFKCQCPQCGKQFSRRSSLGSHIKDIHEGISKTKCEFCEYHATKRANLFVHFQKMHKDINIEIFREKMQSTSRRRGPRKTEQN